MNNYFLTVICLVVMLCGCSLDYYEDKVDFSSVPEYETIAEYEQWVSLNIKSISDSDAYGKKHHKESIQETLDNGFGDCENKNGLFLAVVYQRLGIEGYMIVVKYNQYPSDENHALAIIDNQVYDCTFTHADITSRGFDNSYDVILSWSLSTILGW